MCENYISTKRETGIFFFCIALLHWAFVIHYTRIKNILWSDNLNYDLFQSVFSFQYHMILGKISLITVFVMLEIKQPMQSRFILDAY
jgi:hypothetical protein